MKAIDEETFIKSDTFDATGNDLAFRGYKYMKMQVRLTFKDKNAWIYCDTGCIMTCIDRNFLMKNLSDVELYTVKCPIGVCRIGNGYNQTEDYVTIPLYILGIKDSKYVIDMIIHEFHIITKIPYNILLSIDILNPEGFIIDCRCCIIILASCCDIKIPLHLCKDAVPIIQLHTVTTKRSVTIPPHISIAISIKRLGLLFNSIDYHFNAHYTKDTLSLMIQEHFPEVVFDKNNAVVLYYNTSDILLKVIKNTAVSDIIL